MGLGQNWWTSWSEGRGVTTEEDRQQAEEKQPLQPTSNHNRINRATTSSEFYAQQQSSYNTIDISNWTNNMVMEWLSINGFDDYKKHFVGLDGSMLESLSKDALVDEMNIPTGVAIKLMRELDRLQTKSNVNNSPSQQLTTTIPPSTPPS